MGLYRDVPISELPEATTLDDFQALGNQGGVTKRLKTDLLKDVYEAAQELDEADVPALVSSLQTIEENVEADRAQVANNTATVTASATQVALDRQNVATNKAAVDAALASVAGGPVISINGKTGVVFTDPLSVADVQPTLIWDLTDPNGAPYKGNFTRATAGGYARKPNGLWVPTGNNEPVIDYGADGKALGMGFFWAYTNILLNSAALSTQTVTVSALTYTLSFRGAGSVALSGAATGVLAGVEANNRVSLTFAASAGTLTVTVAGSVVEASLTATAVPVPYVPTAGAAVTRNADSMIISGADLADAWNSLGGTIFVDSDIPRSPGGRILQIDDGTINNRAYIYRNGGAGEVRGSVISQGVGQGEIGRPASAGAPSRIAYSFKNDAFNLAVGGVNATPDTSGSMPVNIQRMVLYPELNGYIRRVIYWPKALTAAKLQEITA